MKDTDLMVLAASYSMMQIMDILDLEGEELLEYIYPVINEKRDMFPELVTQPVYEEDQ